MDTSFIHSTENNTDQDRFVLLLRVWHPEVTKIEREALSFVFRATEDPSLLEKPALKKSPGGKISMKERKKMRARNAKPKKKTGFGS
mmetsp:Transcript_20877/g.63642  ORF Transcript_20877/g.63642 Transcript_20877/m.63642 type:complete len:87 (+) Transcript_20877:265-525(+)